MKTELQRIGRILGINTTLDDNKLICNKILK